MSENREQLEYRLSAANWKRTRHPGHDEWRPTGCTHDLIAVSIPTDPEDGRYGKQLDEAARMIESVLGADLTTPVNLTGGTFAQRLRQCVDAKRVSHRLLADIAGASNPSVAKWLDGTGAPDVLQLQRICDALDVSADYLIGVDGGTWKEIK